MTASLLALACAVPAPPVVRVEGRTWSAASPDVRVTFPSGWRLAVDPTHFRAGIPGTLFEARSDASDLSVALTWFPLPPATRRLLGDVRALDLVPWMSGADPATEEAPGYRFQRLPRCRGTLERRVEGAADGWRAAYELDVRGGLATLHAWGDRADGAATARAFVCAAVEPA